MCEQQEKGLSIECQGVNKISGIIFLHKGLSLKLKYNFNIAVHEHIAALKIK